LGAWAGLAIGASEQRCEFRDPSLSTGTTRQIFTTMIDCVAETAELRLESFHTSAALSGAFVLCFYELRLQGNFSMPRISAEARAAAMFRGVVGQEPPMHLTAPAKRLWREIVEDRPPDWFRPGSAQLLEVFCQLTIEERTLLRRVRRTQGEEKAKLLQLARQMSGTLVGVAKALRLCTRNDVDRHSRKIDERGDGPSDPLLGGAARWAGRSLNN